MGPNLKQKLKLIGGYTLELKILEELTQGVAPETKAGASAKTGAGSKPGLKLWLKLGLRLGLGLQMKLFQNWG